MAVAPTLPTLYEYYTNDGITAGLSDQQPYFTLNNKNITIYSGAFHYFRVPKKYWRDRLRKMRASGLNTVETYVPWNMHEPKPGVFDFGQGGTDYTDFLDIEEFLKTAQEEDLLALIRPGPYMCGEWEFGGFPSWILRNTSSVRNSNDTNYLSYQKRFLNALLPILALLQFQKGGPIIGFQIENEYGNTGNDDLPYLKSIQQLFIDNGLIELYYTSDPTSANGRGSIPGILQTANFNDNARSNFDKLKQLQENKPSMAMEFYTGWFDHWLENHQTVDSLLFLFRLVEILDYPASVNHYMFIGSTNFGFLNGANIETKGTDNSGLLPDTTSYDYDSPITEYGGYGTKYNIIKDAIAARNPIQTKIPDPPELIPLISYSSLKIESQINFSQLIENNAPTVVESDIILPMELLPINDDSGQSYGYINYRTVAETDAGTISIIIKGYVRDTVMILCNGKLVSPIPQNKNDIDGFGFWRQKDSTLEFKVQENSSGPYTIDILVENVGRVNYGSLDVFSQFKGLTEDVLVNNKIVTNWKIIPIEFKTSWTNSLTNWQTVNSTQISPTLYKFILNIDNDPEDTYIDMREWRKGTTIVNGFVLGRHFFFGPQQTLYLPAPLLKNGENTIIVFEHYTAPDVLKFSDRPIFQSRNSL